MTGGQKTAKNHDKRSIKKVDKITIFWLFLLTTRFLSGLLLEAFRGRFLKVDSLGKDVEN